MIALYVNNEPRLLDTASKVDEAIEEIKKKDPSADCHKQTPVACGACGTYHFDNMEAIHCGCHDRY